MEPIIKTITLKPETPDSIFKKLYDMAVKGKYFKSCGLKNKWIMVKFTEQTDYEKFMLIVGDNEEFQPDETIYYCVKCQHPWDELGICPNCGNKIPW